MLGRVLLKKLPEGDGAGGEDDLVGLHLLPAVAGQGDVHELALVPEVGEGGLDALLEVVPTETELFVRGGPHGGALVPCALDAGAAHMPPLPAPAPPLPTPRPGSVKQSVS